MIFMCSITSLNGAMSFMRSWLVMVAGTVRMHTIALRLTSSVSDVILLHRNSQNEKAERHGDKSKPVGGLLGLIQMHNTVDDLHRGVPTEKGDVVWELLGGGVWSRARCFTGVWSPFSFLGL